jgi:hypothetical protein
MSSKPKREKAYQDEKLQAQRPAMDTAPVIAFSENSPVTFFHRTGCK